MLEEMPMEENSGKPKKIQSFLGLFVLAGLAAFFFYFLYQALTNQIKF
jgi:hypothetical protein